MQWGFEHKQNHVTGPNFFNSSYKKNNTLTVLQLQIYFQLKPLNENMMSLQCAENWWLQQRMHACSLKIILLSTTLKYYMHICIIFPIHDQFSASLEKIYFTVTPWFMQQESFFTHILPVMSSSFISTATMLVRMRAETF